MVSNVLDDEELTIHVINTWIGSNRTYPSSPPPALDEYCKHQIAIPRSSKIDSRALLRALPACWILPVHKDLAFSNAASCFSNSLPMAKHYSSFYWTPPQAVKTSRKKILRRRVKRWLKWTRRMKILSRICVYKCSLDGYVAGTKK